MRIWKVLVIDGEIDTIEETNDEKDLLQYAARKRQKTVHKSLHTFTHMLIAAETEKEARTTAYIRWAKILSREHTVFHF